MGVFVSQAFLARSSAFKLAGCCCLSSALLPSPLLLPLLCPLPSASLELYFSVFQAFSIHGGWLMLQGTQYAQTPYKYGMNIST